MLLRHSSRAPMACLVLWAGLGWLGYGQDVASLTQLPPAAQQQHPHPCSRSLRSCRHVMSCHRALVCDQAAEVNTLRKLTRG